jgi:hypothetical protein
MKQSEPAGEHRRSTARALLTRPEWVILLCLLSVAPFLLTFWVHGDGIGYVACLRSAVVERNLELSDEFEHLAGHIRADAWGLPTRFLSSSSHQPGIDPTFHAPRPDPVTGRTPAYFSVGPPIAWAPAYLAAHGLMLLRGGPGAAEGANGYGGLYYLAIALSSLAFGAAGLLLAYRFTTLAAPRREAFWAVLTVAWASPLLYYLYLAPSYGHALTVFTSGAFFLYWWSTRHSDRAATWFRWGLLAGILFLVRWNDVVLAVPVFVVEAARMLRGDGTRRTGASIRLLLACVSAAGLGFLLTASPQFGVWQYFHGRPWVRYPVDYIVFTPDGWWGTLFSSRHGLFVWTPVTLFAVAGLFRLFRRDRELAGVCLAALLLLVASNGTVRDWWGGASFGMRRLVSGTPLFALGFAVFLEDVRAALTQRKQRRSGGVVLPAASAGPKLLAPLAFLGFSIWNLLLLAQYALGMISHSGPVSLATIAANQPQVVVRLVRLVGEVLK